MESKKMRFDSFWHRFSIESSLALDKTSYVTKKAWQNILYINRLKLFNIKIIQVLKNKELMNFQLFRIFWVVLITLKRIFYSFYSNLLYKNSKNVNVYEYKNNM